MTLPRDPIRNLHPCPFRQNSLHQAIKNIKHNPEPKEWGSIPAGAPI